MTTILMLLAGLGLLVLGGELLVRGSVQVAENFRVSPLLIGLTLVGFGTSTPELVTSIEAARAGSPGIAIGNIVGSNIANVLFILGISALITPIVTESKALKRDGVLVVLTALMFVVIGALALPLGLLTGLLFVALLVAYLTFAYHQEKSAPEQGHGAAFERAEAYEETRDGPLKPGHAAASQVRGIALPLAIAIAGLVVVVVGGKILVENAILLARAWGISETVIGLTIVAVGTSMPELVTSVVAALRGHSAVAIGNVMGSNIYNILGIGGLTALIAPTVVPPEIAAYDNLVMVAASAAMLLLAATGLRIDRKEGALLLAGYGAYLWSIWPK